MNNIPNMVQEVIEAIHLQYEDNPDLETDCMLYLQEMVKYDEASSLAVWDWFNEHERCPICGTPLQYHTYKEPHTELGQGVYEEMREPYCPNCDIG